MADKQYSTPEDIPVEFSSLEEAGEFWDTHSTADYEDLLEPVAVEINLPPRHPGKQIWVAADLAFQLAHIAKQQGISTETLANLWLQEKLAQRTS
jgi:hypothetical protein